MALFITTTKRPTSGGSGKQGETVVWENYSIKLAELKSLYSDDFGNIKSQKFYDEWQKLITETLNSGVTPAKTATLINDMNQLRFDKNKFNLTNSISSDSLDTLERDLKETWKNVWSDKQVLAFGNVQGMFGYMEDYINLQKEELENQRQVLLASTVDTDIIDAVAEAIDYLGDQEVFWRDAQINPQRYRLDMNTNDNGQLTDVIVRNINDSDNNFAPSGVNYGGYEVYLTPNKAIKSDDPNEQRVRIGNLAFNRYDNASGFTQMNEGDLDLSTLTIQDPLMSRVGSTLMTPAGVGYIKNEDGTYFKVNQSYAPSAGINLNQSGPVSTITQDEANKIEQSQNVQSYIQDVEMMSKQKQIYQSEMQSYFLPQNSIFSTTPLPQESAQNTPRFTSTQKPKPTKEPNQSTGGFTNTVKNIFGGMFSGEGVEDTMKGMGLK